MFSQNYPFAIDVRVQNEFWPKCTRACDVCVVESEDILETKRARAYSKISLMKTSENNFIFLPVFYLFMCLMKAPKSFEKMAILERCELVFLKGAKTHTNNMALK